MKKNPVTRSDDLSLLFDAVARDIVDSINYRKLFLAVRKDISKYPRVFSQSNTYWQLSLRALSDTAMLTLCRVFDTQNGALSLPHLLDIIIDNKHLFSKAQFKSRLANNEHLENLVQYSRELDISEIEEHRCKCSKNNILVHRLILWRNNYYAHRAINSTLENLKILKFNEITWAEIEQLSTLALNIYNHYSSLYRATSWSSMLIGEEDFKSLLGYAQQGLNAYLRKIDLEFQQGEPDLPLGHA